MADPTAHHHGHRHSHDHDHGHGPCDHARDRARRVPMAMAEAFRSGNLGVMDFYRMRNIQADTGMRESIATGGAGAGAGSTTNTNPNA